MDALPEDADWEEVIERIAFNSAISRGLAELDSGQGIPVETLEEELTQWVKP